MSKFGELCKSYKTSRDNYFSYRDESVGFARELMDKYIEYLQVPKENFKFVPLDKDPKPDTRYSLFAAIHLNNDSFWHLGLQITIYSALNEFPQQPILVRFMFKKTDKNTFSIKISEQDSGHSICRENESDFSEFFEFLQSQIRDNFENGLQEFLEQSAPIRTIGFVQQ